MKFRLLASFFILLCFKAERSEGKCLVEGAFEFDGYCYFGDDYWNANGYAVAKRLCEIRGAKLTVIKSQAQQDFLNGKFEKFHYYLDLQKINETWKWLDGTRLHYVNWDSYSEGCEDTCAVMQRYSTKWTCESCDMEGAWYYGYVCQVPALASDAPVPQSSANCDTVSQVLLDGGMLDGSILFKAIGKAVSENAGIFRYRTYVSHVISMGYRISDIIHGKTEFTWNSLQEIKKEFDDYCNAMYDDAKKQGCYLLKTTQLGDWGNIGEFIQCLNPEKPDNCTTVNNYLFPDRNATDTHGIMYSLDKACSCGCSKAEREIMMGMENRVNDILENTKLTAYQKQQKVAAEVRSCAVGFGIDTLMFDRILTTPILGYGTIEEFLRCAFGCNNSGTCDALKKAA